jgi:hypothetical protein
VLGDKLPHPVRKWRTIHPWGGHSTAVDSRICTMDMALRLIMMHVGSIDVSILEMKVSVLITNKKANNKAVMTDIIQADR